MTDPSCKTESRLRLLPAGNSAALLVFEFEFNNELLLLMSEASDAEFFAPVPPQSTSNPRNVNLTPFALTSAYRACKLRPSLTAPQGPQLQESFQFNCN